MLFIMTNQRLRIARRFLCSENRVPSVNNDEPASIAHRLKIARCQKRHIKMSAQLSVLLAKLHILRLDALKLRLKLPYVRHSRT